jgi:hypothetical protein
VDSIPFWLRPSWVRDFYVLCDRLHINGTPLRYERSHGGTVFTYTDTDHATNPHTLTVRFCKRHRILYAHTTAV